MVKIRMIFLVVGMLFCFHSFGQNALDVKMSEWRQLSLDSLKSLENGFEDAENQEFLTGLYQVIEQYAEVKNDTVQLIWAYQRMAWHTEKDNTIELLTKAIFLAESSDDKNREGDAIYLLGVFYYNTNQPHLAIEKFIEAYGIARSEKYHELLVDALNAIASIKSEYGEDHEALALQLESFDYLKTHANKIPHYYETYLISLDNMALGYLQLKMIDSARSYTKKALTWALRHNDMDSYKEFRVMEAQVNYYDGNYLKARDSILKYYDTMSLEGKADLLFYLGMIEGKIGQPEKKLMHFEKMHKTLGEINFPLIDNTKELYHFLTLHDTSKSDEYLKRWVYYDSLNSEIATTIKAITFKDFDIPRKQDEKLDMFQTLVSWQKSNTILWWCVSLILPVLLGFIYFYFRERSKLKKIRNMQVFVAIETKGQEPELDIHPDIIKRIRENLKRWESQNGFLDVSINQKGLAEKLNTNDTYLSIIINHYRHKNFSTYLKDLRIDYALQELRNNPQLSFGKSVIQLAERFGFKSKELFSRSMKAKIGVTPSVFLKRLKSDNL